jgi:hypothetical protein
MAAGIGTDRSFLPTAAPAVEFSEQASSGLWAVGDETTGQGWAEQDWTLASCKWRIQVEL